MKILIFSEILNRHVICQFSKISPKGMETLKRIKEVAIPMLLAEETIIYNPNAAIELLDGRRWLVNLLGAYHFSLNPTKEPSIDFMANLLRKDKAQIYADMGLTEKQHDFIDCIGYASDFRNALRRLDFALETGHTLLLDFVYDFPSDEIPKWYSTDEDETFLTYDLYPILDAVKSALMASTRKE